MELTLTTSQKLALSQKMMQSAEILQMSSQELIEYIKELSVENPLVEYEEKKESETKFDTLRKKLEWLDSRDEQNRTYYREEREDEDQNDDWKFKESVGESLEEHLISQVNVLTINKELLKISHYIIESMDSNGYIDQDVSNIAFCLNKSENEILKALNIVQSLEPTGVGARNLKECLLLQLKASKNYNELAEKIIESYLETLGKNQLHIIAKKLKVSIDEVTNACNLIKSLNPKPGRGFSKNTNLEYITPDAIVVKQNDKYEIILNDNYFPTININSYYKNIISNESEDKAKEYVYNKMKQAEWAMKCISKRNSTLLKTIEVIIDIQTDFFDYGKDYLKPMRLSDVAERIDMHESTVSRAVRDKYLQCSWGVFPLNSFFAMGVSKKSSSGKCEGKVTPDNIKRMIKNIIDDEDKTSPLSDRKITDMLNEKGIDISRRTVAKYREAIGILGTTGRKKY